jgi:hypothetical protein
MRIEAISIRVRFVLGCAVVGLALGAPALAHAGNDPELRWQTVETEHFRINFYSGEREAALRLADTAETLYDTMDREFGLKPPPKVEVALTDQSESANGSATALPYNAVDILMTAPEDLSPLGDTDDWLTELMTHEYTHTVQLDRTRGLPALVNALMGRTWAPNQIQPRWILEGLAVVEETKHTSAGRLRSAVWDMYMRTDVREQNLATLDQMGNFVRRWPQGNIWYVYGSYFMRWIMDTYGVTAIRAMIEDYGAQPVPWGFNRSIRRATGKTFEELYEGWVTSIRRETAERDRIVRAAGIREGVRLTYHGQGASYPRWITDQAWPAHKGQLAYFRDDGHSRPGIYAVHLARDADGAVTKRAEDGVLLFRTNNETPMTFTPEGDAIFASIDGFRSIFAFNDLHRYRSGVLSTSGHEGERIRLTQGFRATEPAVSPDGRHIAFISNHRGTRYLQMADLGEEEIRNVRTIVRSEPHEQAYTPRFSPDGTHLAYSAWSYGGYRDIRCVDLRTRTFESIAVDRAQDGDPSFSPDGKYIYFHSDRRFGVMNIYAWHIESKKLYQVTNVLNGAFFPEVSPDGKTLAYVGYTKRGFDLYAMPLKPDTFAPAEPFLDTRPTPPQVVPHEKKVVDFNPLRTMAPRRYSLQYTQGAFGPVGIVQALGSDISNFHTVALTAYSEFERPTLQGTIAYTYGRTPFDMSVSMSRNVVPTDAFRVGNRTRAAVQEVLSADTSVSFNKLRMFDSQSYWLGYSFARYGNDVERVPGQFDPFETATLGTRGYAGFLRAGYTFSNVESYLHSVSAERGFSIRLEANMTHPALASDFRGFSVRSDFTGYVPMPWLRHHVLAMHAGGGTSGGGYPGRGLFFVGGFTDFPILDTVRNTLVQGGLVLRGYEPVALVGPNFTLFNAEYRFPIVNIDRGPSSLPIFLNRISGNVFLDYGSAFDDFNIAEYKTGTGAEAWFDLMLGYNLGLTFRLGYARGLASKGIDKPYFIVAVPY